MRTIKKEINSIISSDPEVRNGLPVFKNTRVPVYTVLEHLALGWTLKDLGEAFPAVKTEYIIRLLKSYSGEFKAGYEQKKR